jgi:hypothetical protein
MKKEFLYILGFVIVVAFLQRNIEKDNEENS